MMTMQNKYALPPEKEKFKEQTGLKNAFDDDGFTPTHVQNMNFIEHFIVWNIYLILCLLF